MSDFGVIELAGAKTTSAPGWAYVPDNRLNMPAAATVAKTTTQQAGRKRPRNVQGGGLTMSDLTARQENKMRKELEALDRDGGRDVTIPLPGKSGRPHGKRTANALNESNAAATTTSTSKRSASHATAAARKDSSSTTYMVDPSATDAPPDHNDPSLHPTASATTMTTSTILAQPYRPGPAAHPGDMDPLLVSRVPSLPTDAELRALLAAPPLSYSEARCKESGDRYPARVFCEVCGYWGRVRCLKCGTRVCALECLETHREECMTRYGI